MNICILAHIHGHYDIAQLQSLYDQSIAFLTFDHCVSLLFSGTKTNNNIRSNKILNKRYASLSLYGAKFHAPINHPVLKDPAHDFEIIAINEKQIHQLTNRSKILL